MKHDSANLLGGSFKTLVLPKAASGQVPQKENQLLMKGGLLVTAVKSPDGGLEWKPTVDFRDPLFAFDEHTFTNVGLEGYAGPTIAQLRANAAYSAKAWTKTSYFNAIGGIQLFTVPVSGIYRMELLGATRRTITAAGRCPVARMIAEFELTKGDTLRIAVGQVCAYTRNIITTSYGGAGGTFVESTSLGILAVAGGAGGSQAQIVQVGNLLEAAGPSMRNGVIVPAKAAIGHSSSDTAYASQGNVSSYAYGGGGLTGTRVNTNFGQSFAEGARGGEYPSDVERSAGGFGGGGFGATDYNTSYQVHTYGGGGGYTGGDPGGSTRGAEYGGTGGSYIAPFALASNKQLTDGTSAHAGSFKLTLVG